MSTGNLRKLAVLINFSSIIDSNSDIFFFSFVFRVDNWMVGMGNWLSLVKSDEVVEVGKVLSYYRLLISLGTIIV